MFLVALDEAALAADRVEDLLEEIAEGQVGVADQVGPAALGTLQRAPDRLRQRAHRHVVGAAGGRVVGDLRPLATRPGGQRLVAACRNAGNGADDRRRVQRRDVEAGRGVGPRPFVGERTGADISVGPDQVRHDLVVVGAELDEAADAGALGQRGEVRHALDLHDAPELGLVGTLRDMADVLAGGEDDRVERLEIALGKCAARIVANEHRHRRHRRARGGRLARGKRHRVALRLQVGGRMAADHAGAADDQDLQAATSPFLRRESLGRRGGRGIVRIG